jgi:hypothetical protein
LLSHQDADEARNVTGRRGVREPGPQVITLGVERLVWRKPSKASHRPGELLQQIASSLSIPNNRTSRTLPRTTIAGAFMISSREHHTHLACPGGFKRALHAMGMPPSTASTGKGYRPRRETNRLAMSCVMTKLESAVFANEEVNGRTHREPNDADANIGVRPAVSLDAKTG